MFMMVPGQWGNVNLFTDIPMGNITELKELIYAGVKQISDETEN